VSHFAGCQQYSNHLCLLKVGTSHPYNILSTPRSITDVDPISVPNPMADTDRLVNIEYGRYIKLLTQYNTQCYYSVTFTLTTISYRKEVRI